MKIHLSLKAFSKIKSKLQEWAIFEKEIERRIKVFTNQNNFFMAHYSFSFKIWGDKSDFLCQPDGH